MSEVQQGARWRSWWPFALLVLAAASRWMLAGARPEAESTLGSQALGCAWAAGLWGSVAGLRGRLGSPLRGEVMSEDVTHGLPAGMLLLCGPFVGLLLHATGVDPSGLTMALALTPVAVATALAALGQGATEGVTGRLWPGLAAVAGLLLVLVQPNLGDARADAVFALAPICAGVGAALFCVDREQPAGHWREVAALAGGMVVFGLGWAVSRLVFQRMETASLPAVACDGLLALLSVLTLRRLGAVRWAAQFTLVPLLILLEGIGLVRPAITTRWVVGLVLLMVASVYLLLPDDREEA